MGLFGGGGSSVDLASPPAIGNTTPNTGKFTTVESTSRDFTTGTTAGSVRLGLGAGNTRGTNSINIQSRRADTSYVASGTESLCIGDSLASGSQAVAIGSANNQGCFASGNGSVAIAAGNNSYSNATQNGSVAIGGNKPFGGGSETIASGAGAVAIGNSEASGSYAVAVGAVARATLYGQVSFQGFAGRTQYGMDGFFFLNWMGTTTNATQTEIFLGGVSNTRAIIGANRMWAGQIYISALMSDSSKALFAHRTIAMKRDGSNNTALIGSVQTLGSDQNTGSPTWTIDIDVNDTNESLRIRVTGAASETVYWKACAYLQEHG